MNNYCFSHITWQAPLKSQDWESPDKTFEFLCADFMKIRFELDRAPLPSTSFSYPWTEWKPIFFNGKYYHFQAKWGDAGFNGGWTFKKSLDQIDTERKSGTYLLDVCWLFSPRDCPVIGSGWQAYFAEYEAKNWLELPQFFGNDFLSELKKPQYEELLHKYFDSERLRTYIYDNHAEAANQNEVDRDVGLVELGFSGNPDLYSRDLAIAKHAQKKYSTRKLAFIGKPYVMETFDRMEADIADELFYPLSLRTFDSLDGFTEKGISLLDRDRVLRNKYSAELSALVSSKEGIFVNYWTTGKSVLDYIPEEQISFIDKRNG